MSTNRTRFRITFRLERADGFHQTSTRLAETLWLAVSEINDLLSQGAEIINVSKEHWINKELDQQEKDTIKMLTHDRVKL